MIGDEVTITEEKESSAKNFQKKSPWVYRGDYVATGNYDDSDEPDIVPFWNYSPFHLCLHSVSGCEGCDLSQLEAAASRWSQGQGEKAATALRCFHPLPSPEWHTLPDWQREPWKELDWSMKETLKVVFFSPCSVCWWRDFQFKPLNYHIYYTDSSNKCFTWSRP